MNIQLILTIAFFMILISIQFTLNLILRELRDLKRIIIKEKEADVINKVESLQ